MAPRSAPPPLRSSTFASVPSSVAQLFCTSLSTQLSYDVKLSDSHAIT